MMSDRADRMAHDPEAGDPAAHGYERDPFHPGVARLDRFLSSTNHDAPRGLVEDIGRQLARRPGSTPARRLSSATRARDRVAIVRTLRQALAMVLGAGHVRPMMRAQAAGVLVFVLVASGVSSVAGLAGVQAGVEVAGTVAGTIAREAAALRDGRTDSRRAQSPAAVDRTSDGVVTKRAKSGQPSKGRKQAADKGRPGQASKGKNVKDGAKRPDHPLKRKKDEQARDDRPDHPLKRKKDEKGSRNRKDDRSDKPSRGRKDEKVRKGKDDRLEKSPKGKKDKPDKKGKKDKPDKKGTKDKKAKHDADDRPDDQPGTVADWPSGD
jgi:hypothetical protein